MRLPIKLLMWIAGITAGLVAIYYYAFPTYEHRFRLTFQVEVNGQVKEGSGVITVYDRYNPMVSGGPVWHRTARGPSPWIDLGERGVLLVAIIPHVPFVYEPPPYAASHLSFVGYFDAKYPDIGVSDDRVGDIRKQKGLRKLRADQMPEFIWLPDPLRRASAQNVPAHLISETISGVRLLGATIEITDDQPDVSLYSKLPWLAALEQQENKTGITIRPAPFELHARNIIGEY